MERSLGSPNESASEKVLMSTRTRPAKEDPLLIAGPHDRAAEEMKTERQSPLFLTEWDLNPPILGPEHTQDPDHLLSFFSA